MNSYYKVHKACGECLNRTLDMMKALPEDFVGRAFQKTFKRVRNGTKFMGKICCTHKNFQQQYFSPRKNIFTHQTMNIMLQTCIKYTTLS